MINQTDTCFQFFKEADYFISMDDKQFKTVKCFLCAHYCEIKNNNYGICKVRYNSNGKLLNLSWGSVEGLAIDPIEKKPLYHFKPSSQVLSFGTPGCNFFCLNCQNSNLSQSIKKINFSNYKSNSIDISTLINSAIKYSVDGIAYTYSEPTIFFEYARDIILQSREHSEASRMFHIFVSNGYFSKELLDVISANKLIDGINIDLKFFDDKKYKKVTGGHLQPVLDSIAFISKQEIHLEITNLVIPELNDSDEDFDKVTKFISSLSDEIPFHISRFHPHYKMLSKSPTPLNSLLRAKEIAVKNGLKYVYIGNSDLPNVQNTYCPQCNFLLIERKGYVAINHLVTETRKDECPRCGFKIKIIN